MHFQSFARIAGAAALALTATACDDFLSVENPTIIEASTVDPIADAATFANSALNNFYVAADNVAVYQAWFTGEAWLGDTFPTRNDIAKRQIDISNGTLSTEIWNPLAQAVSTGEAVLNILDGVTGGTSTMSRATAALASGYSIQFMAETFCQVVISSSLDDIGAPIAPAAGAAEAAARFELVRSELTGVTGAEAARLRNAATVGLARALLFQGDYAGAIAAAQQVPDTFTYMIPRVDDPSNRTSLGNTVFSFTLSRPSLVVPPYFRALNDPRVTSALGGPGYPTKTQGNDLAFYRQRKYTEWGSDVRLASGLEARYIIAEAQLKQGDPTAALALIAERQAAGSVVDGDDFAADTNSVLTELLDQRARDFYLEAQHMGSWLRNGTATPYAYRAGDAYYAEPGSIIGTQTCMPVPDDETLFNPGFTP